MLLNNSSALISKYQNHLLFPQQTHQIFYRIMPHNINIITPATCTTKFVLSSLSSRLESNTLSHSLSRKRSNRQDVRSGASVFFILFVQAFLQYIQLFEPVFALKFDSVKNRCIFCIQHGNGETSLSDDFILHRSDHNILHRVHLLSHTDILRSLRISHARVIVSNVLRRQVKSRKINIFV